MNDSLQSAKLCSILKHYSAQRPAIDNPFGGENPITEMLAQLGFDCNIIKNEMTDPVHIDFRESQF